MAPPHLSTPRVGVLTLTLGATPHSTAKLKSVRLHNVDGPSIYLDAARAKDLTAIDSHVERRLERQLIDNSLMTSELRDLLLGRDFFAAQLYNFGLKLDGSPVEIRVASRFRQRDELLGVVNDAHVVMR